ncbi:CBU_0592 family membrane protein [Niabella sp. 22666]|uniref:CBU_0592 family membrane protein n=1 Tax=Niabella sp. 22666 TaxID=3453954 RepID=UPI003F865635
MSCIELLAVPILKAFVSESVSSFVGWLGTGFYLLAYLLVSFNKVKANKPAYHILNILGAVGLIVHAVYMNDGPNLICNLAWLSIAVIAILAIFFRKTKQN